MSEADFLAHAQDGIMGSNETSTLTPAQEPEDGPPDKLLATQHTTKPGELQRVMSDKLAVAPATKHLPPTPQQEVKQDEFMLNGVKYRSVNNHTIIYSIQKVNTRKHLALIDRGANGGIGDDACIIHKTNSGLIHTQRGPAIAIMHQQAYIGKGQSILSSGQMEHFKIVVDEKSTKAGGQQH
ncbi:unnamed protein product [Cylindrotheca closterium]|uniref:Uncharacterized protein n=1 Tax=Cylindrotheca closterium TaxID=2856 RepID=A0AAD2FZP6_9STRA|nr:unnamed protein product [Cylindrotheca closterium]